MLNMITGKAAGQTKISLMLIMIKGKKVGPIRTVVHNL